MCHGSYVSTNTIYTYKHSFPINASTIKKKKCRLLSKGPFYKCQQILNVLFSLDHLEAFNGISLHEVSN